ncbi:MAG: putative Ig domain-containing protein [Sulfuriferula sp.]
MGSMSRRVLGCAWMIAGLSVNLAAQAATPAQLDAVRAKSLAWFYTHQNGDGSWQTASGIKTQPTALAMDALANAGLKSARPYAMAQAWLANAPTSSNDSLSRQVNALAHSGANVSALTQRLITQRDDTTKSWGAYAKYQGGFPDTALAMDALLASGAAYADTGSGLGFIAYKQNADGGWPNSATEPNSAASRLIPTAQNVLTLSRYKPLGWNVDSYLTNGVNWLKSQQKGDGGFAEDTGATIGNPYDTALVYQALNQAKLAGNAAAIGAQTTLDNAQTFLVNNQGTDGSWGGDALATAVALQTLPATTLADTDKDGVPDVVEALLGTNPGVADAHGLTAGNGQSVIGLTASLLVANATVGVPFTYTLSASGGTAPYIYAIAAGTLPDGLSLNPGSGVISGTPTRNGPFNFNYQATDASSASLSTAGQIVVAAAAVEDGDVPTLPEWGAILMAALLMLSQLLQNRKRRS